MSPGSLSHTLLEHGCCYFLFHPISITCGLDTGANHNWIIFSSHPHIYNIVDSSAVAPDDAGAYVSSGRCYQQAGQSELALADYAKAIALAPKNSFPADSNLTVMGYAHAIAAVVDQILGDPQEGRGYESLGDLDERLGSVDAAAANYRRAADLYEQQGDWLARGLALGRLEGLKPHDAAYYDASVAAEPSIVAPYLSRANYYAALGEWDRVLADYNVVIELDPNIVNAYTARAAAYQYAGEPDRALADYTKAIELSPYFSGNYEERAELYFAQGQLDLPAADYSQAIEVGPTYAELYSAHAEVYSALGDLARAIADYDQAIERHTPDAALFAARGRLHADNGDRAAAVADLQTAADMLQQQGSTDQYRAVMERLDALR